MTVVAFIIDFLLISNLKGEIDTQDTILALKGPMRCQWNAMTIRKELEEITSLKICHLSVPNQNMRLSAETMTHNMKLKKYALKVLKS